MLKMNKEIDFKRKKLPTTFGYYSTMEYNVTCYYNGVHQNV